MSRITVLIIGLLLLVLVESSHGQTKQPATLPKMPDPKAEPLKYGGKTLTDWKLELVHPDPSRRTVAIMAIVNFGESSSEVVPLLLERTTKGETDMSPKLRAITALRLVAVNEKQVPDVVRAMARLLSPFNEPQIAIRYEAAWTLQRFQEDAAPAMSALVLGTKDRGSWEVRHRCLQMLWRVAGQNKSGPEDHVVDAIIAAQSDHASLVRLEAVIGLAGMGKPANPNSMAKVIAALDNASKSINKVYAVWAYAGLVSMSASTNDKTSDLHLQMIAKFLTSRDLEVKAQAAQALGALGHRAKKAIPSLIHMLSDKEAVSVHGACVALSQIGDKDDKVIDALVGLLDNEDVNKVVSACNALAQIGHGNSLVETAFEKQLARTDRKEKKYDGLQSLFRDALAHIKKPLKK